MIDVRCPSFESSDGVTVSILLNYSAQILVEWHQYVPIMVKNVVDETLAKLGRIFLVLDD